MEEILRTPYHFMTTVAEIDTNVWTSWHDTEFLATPEFQVPSGYLPFVFRFNSVNYPSPFSEGDIIAVPIVMVGSTGYRNDAYNIILSGDSAASIEALKYKDGKFVPSGCVVEIGSEMADGDALEKIKNYYLSILQLDIYDKLQSQNVKLDSEIALTEGLRGAVVDVKNAPADIKIEPLYVGDRADKRAKTEEKMAGLFADGYRIQNVLGLSEDLARVLFVKYPEPNDAVEGGR